MKKNMNMEKPLYIFLIGGAGNGKTFTTEVIFHMLIQLYDEHHSIDPLKPKRLVLAYTRKVAYNAGGIIFHFLFLMPFNKSVPTPLSKETLDALRKIYQELRLDFIDEISILGSCFLFFIDDKLRNIKHVQKKRFGNFDILFCSDLYQTQPIQDSLIFEQPILNKNLVPYDFWKENVAINCILQ